MFLKIILPVFFILSVKVSPAQKIIFSDNFENKKIDSAWQVVNGNWRIGDVQEMRIAPAEDGYQYMLCSGDKGFIGSQVIRLRVDLPDTGKKITLSFSYYILANAPGTIVEVAFHKKDLKDGLRGKIWTGDLTINRRWAPFQKTLTIPAGANEIQIVFFGLESSGKKDRIVCFDNVIILFLH